MAGAPPDAQVLNMRTSRSSPPSRDNISRILGEVAVRYDRCVRELTRGRDGAGASMAVGRIDSEVQV